MTPRFHYGQPADDRELATYADLLAVAFGAAPEEVRPKISVLGPEPVRLLKTGGGIVAGLIAHDCGQWFGGRRAPMAAIAAVATEPPHRAGGGATKLMQSLLRELHARGTALSVLYPASRPLYRRAGYEMAGGRYEITFRPRETRPGDRDLRVREARAEDVPAIGRLFARSVARDYGPLDWGSAGWQRAMRTWRGSYPCFVVEGDDGFEGYISYMAARKDHTLTVFDFFACTPRGARRLLTFLCDHRAQVEEAKWAGRLDEPMLLMLQEGTHRVNKAGAWMLRIVDVPAALAQRGYARSAEATLHLDVRDDILAANRGCWILEVSGGRGHIRSGGRGTIRLDVRGLAPLFSGHLTARDLAEWTAYLSAPPRQVAMLEAVFRPASPWMAARF